MQYRRGAEAQHLSNTLKKSFIMLVSETETALCCFIILKRRTFVLDKTK